MEKILRILCAVVVLGCAAAAVRADEDYDAPFSLRFPAALTRFASYPDVAAVGNASAASRWSTSANPAAVAWSPAPSDLHLSASPQSSWLSFEEGADIGIGAVSTTWESRDWGIFQPSFAAIRTGDGDTTLGAEMEFEAEYGLLQWGIKPSETWAVGAAVSVTRSSLRFHLDGMDLSDTEGLAYGIRGGGLADLGAGVKFGLVIDYGIGKSESDLLVFGPLGPEEISERDEPKQFLARAGLSYEWEETVYVYADYQYARFSGEEGRLRLHRGSAGIEVQLFRGIFLRTGGLVDDRGEFAWTCGIGVMPSGRLSVDFGFQTRMFPELAPELGDAPTFAAAVSLAF